MHSTGSRILGWVCNTTVRCHVLTGEIGRRGEEPANSPWRRGQWFILACRRDDRRSGQQIWDSWHFPYEIQVSQPKQEKKKISSYGSPSMVGTDRNSGCSSLDWGAFYLGDVHQPLCVPRKKQRLRIWSGWEAGHVVRACWCGGRELLLEVVSPRGTQQRPLGRGWKELVDTKDNWL